MNARDLLEADALRSFAVFAEHRNFTAAAASLRISQPSLHVKIRKLSAALGVALYERHGRTLTLTAAGERLAAFASDGRRRLDDFLGEFHEGQAALTVAAGPGSFRWVIGEAIRRISHSGRPVRIVTADRDAALAALGSGSADVAVIAHDPPPPPMEAARIAAYPQVLAVDRRHPLADRDQIGLADLDGLAVIVPPPERAHRRALERALAAAGASWTVAAEADGWDLLVHFASLGLGATVVNGCVGLPEGLAAVPIADLPSIAYWAVWRAQRRSLVTDFLTALEQ